jgi:hypothetical protein
MKTTMQELKEFYKNNNSFYSYTKDDIIKVLQLFLEKEKEQIRLAFFRDGHEYWDNITFEEYYNQTYNKNK